MQYNSFRYILLVLIFTTSYIGDINAQALNDDCFSAIQLSNVQNWCSSGSQFNNFSAVESGYGPATCFSQGGHDVWYSFTAIASDITILIKPGTMKKPEAALYIGVCNGVINELECQTNLSQGGVLQLYQGGLFPGNVYFFGFRAKKILKEVSISALTIIFRRSIQEVIAIQPQFFAVRILLWFR